MSSKLFRIGEILRGRVGRYVITKEIQDTVWFARNQANNKTVVIKKVESHARVKNERDVLRRLEISPYLRPLLDEIDDTINPENPSIVLKHLDDHLLGASIKQKLNRLELKRILRSILDGIAKLHEEGYVHTDIKPDNVFVNYGAGIDDRFSEVLLGDLGGACRIDSDIARSGTPVGAPIWTSPEVLMEAPWNTATDIWSFGTMAISLTYGGDFNIFRPAVRNDDHDEYLLEVLKEQFKFFGPFPGKIDEISSQDTIQIILFLMQEIPLASTTPFERITEAEVCREDKLSIGKIMKMDWRDRPTARDLLSDEWFQGEISEEKYY